MVKIDRIIHSRRKTYALVIELDGSLTVRAPLQASRAQIDYLVQEKADWIQEKQNWQKSHPEVLHHKKYITGEHFYYLGNAYPMEVVSAANPLLELQGDRFHLAQAALPHAEKVFINWYHQQARHVIGELVRKRADGQGLAYRSLRITSAKRRWGSCGAKGTLNFSWRLVMAPQSVIDYVIVHELVHLEIRNHSRAYWDRVAHWMPDYKQQVAWLKANGRYLTL
jgi:hypothetical protein